MVKILQDIDTISIEFADSNIELVRVIDIVFSGAIHATSKLPEGWMTMASQERILCVNMGNLNPSMIFNYTGVLTIKNARVYDSNELEHSVRILPNNNDYWEEIGEIFGTSESYYEDYSKEVTKISPIKRTHIVTNDLLTNPEEFYFKDGTPYQGEYHTHEDGQAMTGNRHKRSSVNIYRKDAKGNLEPISKRGKRRAFIRAEAKVATIRDLPVKAKKLRVPSQRIRTTPGIKKY